MRAQPSSADSISPALSSSGVKVLMMYEDLAAGNRAMRVFDSLMQHCGKEISFHTDMWKFDTLRCASISELAAQDARNADIIIISAHGSEELPEELKSWFGHWTNPRSVHPTALVALLDHAAGFLPEFDPAQKYLEQIARQAGMDFVSMFIEQDDNELPIRHAMSDEDNPPPLLEAFCRKISRRFEAPDRPMPIRCH
jgi:hypothetical protein